MSNKKATKPAKGTKKSTAPVKTKKKEDAELSDEDLKQVTGGSSVAVGWVAGGHEKWIGTS